MTIKRINILILLVSALLTFDASATYKGDVNGDGLVDLADMTTMAKAIKAGDAELAKFDLNASGNVDDFDLHALANLIINEQLIEDTGLNVGIGGWDDSGEDFGGTVGAPRRREYATADYWFVENDVQQDLISGESSFSLALQYDGNEANPCGVLFEIESLHGALFENEKYFQMLETFSAVNEFSIYGKPFVKDDYRVLRFILFSPDLKTLPTYEPFGRLYYNSLYEEDQFIISGQSITPYDSATSSLPAQSLYIVYKNGVDYFIGDTLKVEKKGNSVFVTGIESGTNVSLYQISGALIQSSQSTVSNLEIPIPSHGLYILSVGSRTFRLLL